MSRAVVVLWLGTLASRTEAEPELDSWARARLVRIEDARGSAIAARDYDDALVRKIEDLLEQARVASDALDEPAATARLQEASRFIDDHPELPQAPWLAAESLTLEAALLDRRPDGRERARELRRAAQALEGPRVAPLAELDNPNPTKDAPQARVRLQIQGLEPTDRLYWDGRPARRAIVASKHRHHVRVIRQGRPILALWTAVPEADGPLLLPAPAPESCSLDDLGSAQIREQKVVAPVSARCRSWAVARPAAAGGIEIARCAKSRCGPLLPWRRGDGGEFKGPPQPAAQARTPVWLFVAAGIGAAALTGALLWQSGVFEDPEPARDRVLFDGPARPGGAGN